MTTLRDPTVMSQLEDKIKEEQAAESLEAAALTRDAGGSAR